MLYVVGCTNELDTERTSMRHNQASFVQHLKTLINVNTFIWEGLAATEQYQWCLA